MDVEFVRQRITELRLQKGVSEHRMSLDLGHARSYVHGIVSGKTLPSMTEFLYICEYFDITPAQFFDYNEKDVLLMAEIHRECKKLKIEDKKRILDLVKRLQG